MNQERVFSLRNPWFTVSVGGTLAIAVVSILIGFIWLPSASNAFGDRGLWATICSAAGAPSSWYGGANLTGPAPSEVVVLPPLRRARPKPWQRLQASGSLSPPSSSESETDRIGCRIIVRATSFATFPPERACGSSPLVAALPRRARISIILRAS